MSKFVQDDGKDTNIPITSVIRFEASQKYIEVHHLTNKGIKLDVVTGSLKAIMESHADRFTQVHRSHVVLTKLIRNLSVKGHQRYSVKLLHSPNTLIEVPLSRCKYNELKKVYK